MIAKLIFRDTWLEPRQGYKNVPICRKCLIIVSRYPECLISIPRRGDTNFMIIGTEVWNTRCLKVLVASSLKRQFHFEPVDKGSCCEYDSYSINYRNLTSTNTVNYHSNYSYRQHMPPHNSQYFYSTIKSMLEFMNCRYLHFLFTFSLYIYILTLKFLKSHVFLRDCGRFSRYSGTKINI